MKPLVLNAWPRANREESLLCLESTTAPSEVRVLGAKALPDGNYSVEIILSGVGLAMAPDDILVADGLIGKVRVSMQAVDSTPLTSAGAAVQPPGVRLDVVLEHSVQPTWTTIPGIPVRTEFSFSREPLLSLFAGRNVAVDPGHGGKDRGVRGPVDLLEKNVAMDIAAWLQRMLAENGASVLMSRDGDCDVDARGWAVALAATQPHLLVEIHASGEQDPMARSYHIFARRGSEESAQAAGEIANALTERMGVVFKSVEWAGFPAIPLWPAVRVEPLCLTHFVDEANFRAPLFRKRIAQAIFNGIARYMRSVAEGGSARVG